MRFTEDMNLNLNTEGMYGFIDELLVTYIDSRTEINDVISLKRRRLDAVLQHSDFTPAQALMLTYLYCSSDNKLTSEDRVASYLKTFNPETTISLNSAMAILAIDSAVESNADFSKISLLSTSALDSSKNKGKKNRSIDEVSAFSNMENLLRVTLGGQTLNTNYKTVIDRIIDSVLPLQAGENVFSPEQKIALRDIMGHLMDDDRILRHKIVTQMFPAEPKQAFDIGLNIVDELQVYRGTGNGETVFSEPVNEDMFYHISREAMGDSAEHHPYFNFSSFAKDSAIIVISLNTFMRDAHHEHWDGFSTNRVADRLYVEFQSTFLTIPQSTAISPWYYDLGYVDNCTGLNCKVFTVYDNIYYIDRNNNLNVSDTLLPLQEGRGPISE